MYMGFQNLRCYTYYFFAKKAFLFYEEALFSLFLYTIFSAESTSGLLPLNQRSICSQPAQCFS